MAERDPFAAERLGDLPTAGYATKRERELTDAVMLFMRKVERDRPWLLLIVIEGRETFRKRISREYRGLRPLDSLLDQMYDYFVRQAGPNPMQQLGDLISLQQHPLRRVGIQ